MRDVDFSTMLPSNFLNLAGFEQRTFVHPRHKQLDWATGWNQVLQFGLYQKGPDLSEVGSTWLENLNDMRALRPFANSELHALGGESAFLTAAWPPVDASQGPHRVVSIPWLIDTRLVYYRRDLLAQAGIPEATAFSTPEAVYDTLCRLRASGVDYPLALATGGLSIHNLASWVWGRNGHFRSPDYHKIALVEREARRGMADYFRLHPFIQPEARGLDYGGADLRYFAGKSAVLISGQWVMSMVKNRRVELDPAVIDNTGYAMVPGIPYIGSTHLVMWKHTMNDQPALQVIDHLTSREVLNNVFLETGNFPARLSVLNSDPYSSDPDYRLVTDCLRRGRGFRSARLWAGVEMRLNAFHDLLWSDLFADPQIDLEAEIERRVCDLAERMEKTLLANW